MYFFSLTPPPQVSYNKSRFALTVDDYRFRPAGDKLSCEWLLTNEAVLLVARFLCPTVVVSRQESDAVSIRLFGPLIGHIMHVVLYVPFANDAMPIGMELDISVIDPMFLLPDILGAGVSQVVTLSCRPYNDPTSVAVASTVASSCKQSTNARLFVQKMNRNLKFGLLRSFRLKKLFKTYSYPLRRPYNDCMHWSLKQSISRPHKGAVIKFIITVKFNISTRKCKTKTSDKQKHCIVHTFHHEIMKSLQVAVKMYNYNLAYSFYIYLH